MRIAGKAFAKALLNWRDNSLAGKPENNRAYIYSCQYAVGLAKQLYPHHATLFGRSGYLVSFALNCADHWPKKVPTTMDIEITSNGLLKETLNKTS